MVTLGRVVFGADVIAAAMRDRPLHDSQTLEVPDNSDQMRERRTSGIWTRPPDGTQPTGEQRQRPTLGLSSRGVWGSFRAV